MLVEDFTHHNIEMACNLLEVCGRFLYRSEDSHIRTKNLLVSCPKKHIHVLTMQISVAWTKDFCEGRCVFRENQIDVKQTIRNSSGYYSCDVIFYLSGCSIIYMF